MELNRSGSIFGVCAVALIALSGCSPPTETDLQGNEVSSVQAEADKYCQQEMGLAFGTNEYRSCLSSKLEYINKQAGIAAVL